MTFEKIQAIIVDQLDKEEEEVQLTTNFREDLEADSLDLFQIINDIEDEFDIKIESEEGLNTVQDIVSFVETELAK
ncbi:acyl carrier protein [Carnobacterium sp.]|uniref:acyl carrier protein n=1 Tax=Carnobacterium sp. TaxID=48221 RepID=UPI003C75DFB1